MLSKDEIDRGAKNIAIAVNAVRMSGVKNFSNSQLVKLLKEQKCTYPFRVAILLRKSGLICGKRSDYSFKTKEPIEYSVFRPILIYNKNTTCEITIEYAIEFLKRNGYKIYEPITDYKEV